MNKLGRRSKTMIEGITPELALIVGMALARGKVDFSIICGLRTAEEQNKEFLEGDSKLDGYVKKSYHQSGNAIDFIPYPFKGWDDSESFIKVWKELRCCAKHLGYEVGAFIKWDIGHFEIRK